MFEPEFENTNWSNVSKVTSSPAFIQQEQVCLQYDLSKVEFAKSLHMDSEFLQMAQTIRENLNHGGSDIKKLRRQKSSKYNKNLYLSKCALCEESVEDVHHIAEQKHANQEGQIDHFHKNHKYNLIPLCKKHHNLVHEGKINISGFVMTNEGLKLHYELKES